MASPNPFGPGVTQTLACTQTTGNVAVGGTGSQLLVQNAGTEYAFVNVGASDVTASVTFPSASFPVRPASSILVTVPDTFTYVAGICLSGKTTTIFITRGNGGS